MGGRRAVARATMRFAAMALALLTCVEARAEDDYPNITGVWVGEYAVAFPDGHPVFRGESRTSETELRITKQKGNLFWVQKRWRPVGVEDWTVESATGTFYPFDPERISIAELGPAPEDANTGFMEGVLREGKIHLVYRGIGPAGGISFAVTLTKR